MSSRKLKVGQVGHFLRNRDEIDHVKNTKHWIVRWQNTSKLKRWTYYLPVSTCHQVEAEFWKEASLFQPFVFMRFLIVRVWHKNSKAFIMTLQTWTLVRQAKLCGALRDLVPFVQFKKRKKHPWRSVNFSKVAGWSVQVYQKTNLKNRYPLILFMSRA